MTAPHDSADAPQPLLEDGSRILVEDALTGLRQALAGQFITDEELDAALGVSPLSGINPDIKAR